MLRSTRQCSELQSVGPASVTLGIAFPSSTWGPKTQMACPAGMLGSLPVGQACRVPSASLWVPGGGMTTLHLVWRSLLRNSAHQVLHLSSCRGWFIFTTTLVIIGISLISRVSAPSTLSGSRTGHTWRVCAVWLRLKQEWRGMWLKIGTRGL